ncbi:MAG: TetR/AcrR family transcriptional regulator [Paracoccaceae bacterium]
MEILIGERLSTLLDQAEAEVEPKTVEELITALDSIHTFMTSERYVFDLLLRYSGAAAIEEIGPIAHCFERYFRVVEVWMANADFRKDVPPDLLAEGVQAFSIQSMSLKFCALHEAQTMEDRLEIYLKAWLTPAM